MTLSLEIQSNLPLQFKWYSQLNFTTFSARRRDVRRLAARTACYLYAWLLPDCLSVGQGSGQQLIRFSTKIPEYSSQFCRSYSPSWSNRRTAVNWEFLQLFCKLDSLTRYHVLFYSHWNSISTFLTAVPEPKIKSACLNPKMAQWSRFCGIFNCKNHTDKSCIVPSLSAPRNTTCTNSDNFIQINSKLKQWSGQQAYQNGVGGGFLPPEDHCCTLPVG
jgi:hypothetical protein